MDPFDLRNWKEFTTAGGVCDAPAIIDQIAVDSRRIHSSHALFIALPGERVDGHSYVEQAALAGAKFAIVSDTWTPSHALPPITLLRVSNPLQAFQEIAKEYRLQLPTKIIGITGSFGKTMVKDLLYALLGTKMEVIASPESFNSQIGVPMSLTTMRKEHKIAIIEAAISERMEMDRLVDIIRPDYTVLTPIGKKHLATLQDMATLTEETMKFVQATPETGWSLLSIHNHPKQHCPCFCWQTPSSTLPHASILASTKNEKYEVQFPDHAVFQGNVHSGHSYFLNLVNMAIKAAWLMGVPSSNIISILETYRPEPTRTEIWKSSLGATVINDTYCSDPQSIDRALKYFEHASASNRRIFVFGGMRAATPPPPTDYTRIGKTLATSHIDHLILIGNKPFKPLIEEMQRLSPKTEISLFDKYEECFSYLKEHTKEKDLILFKGEKKLPFEDLTETFHESLLNNQCTINLAAIQTNLSLIRQHIPKKTRLMVMVKALAYGTDDIRMSKFMENNGVDIFGVSCVDEGIALKQSGVRQSVFATNATPYEVSKVVKWNLEVGVSNSEFINALAEEAKRQQKIIKVHLHVNTGMSRFGCRPEETLKLAQQILSHPCLQLEGIMTHLACAENSQEDAFTLSQVACFDRVIEELEAAQIEIPWKHAANSGGAIRFHLPQYNMVRLGLSLYGFYGSEEMKQVIDLRLAISLTSRVVGINTCKQGESVSYGRKYMITQATQKIAVLPIGYFDGLHRHYSAKSHVLIQGQKAPMIGNICMDNVMIDITNIPHVEIGDPVLIFGEDENGNYLSPEDLAQSGDSIIYELVTCLGPRIPRIFIYEEGVQVR